MLSIYLKVTIEKKRNTQNSEFLSLKNSFISVHSVFEELQLMQISLNFQTFCCNLKIRGLKAKLCGLYCFYFEKNYDILKSKSPCFLFNKNINFNKNEKESKMGNATHSFRETNLLLQLV